MADAGECCVVSILLHGAGLADHEAQGRKKISHIAQAHRETVVGQTTNEMTGRG